MKICTKCREEKPYSEFYTAKTKSGYRSHCKACMSSAVKERRKVKPQKNKPWAERTETQRNWDKEHPEQARARNQKHYDTKRKFIPRDPELTRAYVNRRRVRLAEAEGSHTVQEWKSLCAKHNGKCVWPGCESTEVTRDHIIPLSKGGTDYIENIQPLCRKHNSIKGTTDVCIIKEETAPESESSLLIQVS